MEGKVSKGLEEWNTPVRGKGTLRNIGRSQSTRETKGKEEGKRVGGKPESMKKRIWAKEEDILLISMVEEFGAKDWSLIAENFWLRGGKQCRERWHNHLRNGVTKDPWTTQE